MDPLVSIIMSAYNAVEYLKTAIESVLGQTYPSFEFIIINDGSTDNTNLIIKEYADKDKRIRIIDHQKNRGLIASLNEGVEIASGEYIARQDADDISLPSRLEKQVRFLQKNNQIGMVGANYHVIDERGTVVDTTNVFTQPTDLALAEIFTNQFGHGTIMARAELLKKHRFDQNYKHAEDYELWSRLAHEAELANLKEPLYKWRLHKGGITASKNAEMQLQVRRINEREFAYFLAHRADYKLVRFWFSSTEGGLLAYLAKKARLYRNMALMYCRKGLRKKAILISLIAWACAPLSRKAYRVLITALQKQKPDHPFDLEVI